MKALSSVYFDNQIGNLKQALAKQAYLEDGKRGALLV